jgi:Arc/MetJ-type ribon-helix-helix transcriptional regulator
MTIEINPETERLVREEISSGHFRSVDELIVTAVNAWRERNLVSVVEAPLHTKVDNLSDLLLRSPFAGANLNLERSQDYPRPVGIE